MSSYTGIGEEPETRMYLFCRFTVVVALHCAELGKYFHLIAEV